MNNWTLKFLFWECDADNLMFVNQESSSNGVDMNVEDVEYATISGTAIGNLQGILSAFSSIAQYEKSNFTQQKLRLVANQKTVPSIFCLKFFGITIQVF